MRHAWRAGNLLAEARRRHRRGTWLPWLQERGLTPRTAQRLLSLRRACPTEADAIEAGSIARALAAAREARLPLDETIVEPIEVQQPPVETIEAPELVEVQQPPPQVSPAPVNPPPDRSLTPPPPSR